MERCSSMVYNVKVLATQEAYTDIHPTLVLMACDRLKQVLQNRVRKAKNKGEEIVQVNGNRIALVYELKGNNDSELVAEVKKARYTIGKGQVRPMQDRKVKNRELLRKARK